jgi:hypothetical protein
VYSLENIFDLNAFPYFNISKTNCKIVLIPQVIAEKHFTGQFLENVPGEMAQVYGRQLFIGVHFI